MSDMVKLQPWSLVMLFVLLFSVTAQASGQKGNTDAVVYPLCEYKTG